MFQLPEFWIDVGGTFTDCLMRSPDGELATFKVLSSGATKGRVTSILNDRSFTDDARIGDPPKFWQGYVTTLMQSDGETLQSGRVIDFDAATGTFTLDGELPAVPEGRSLRYELKSGEEAPILAIRTALGLRLDQPIPPVIVRLGTTRGTNALLTGRGAKVGFVTTRGFRDVLLIANQDRPRLFDLAIQKPEPLFAEVAEIDERLDATGQVLRAPHEAQVREQLLTLKSAGCESLAICLMHAFANPEHELLIERIAREVGFTEISTSSRLAPLIKIVSRGDTTVLDAYLNPILRAYVTRLKSSLSSNASPAGQGEVGKATKNELSNDQGCHGHTVCGVAVSSLDQPQAHTTNSNLDAGCHGLGVFDKAVSSEEHGHPADGVTVAPLSAERGDSHSAAELRTRSVRSTLVTTLKLMTSSGGLVDADRFTGKDSILSGPAGGVIGFSRVAQKAGFPKSIGFDMGGTSTDVSRFDGQYEREFETTKAGVRVVSPMLAIETVAAGGGSVCGFDGVKLFVGPQSAGADPGPACYGRGGPLTITDVNFFLGKIIANRFPFPLDHQAVEQRLTELCDQVARSPLGRTYTPVELAQGFVDIANTTMARAIRKISVARGYDPADYALVTFGGAGAQHACQLARSLGMTHVLSHPYAGVLSAYGIGLADVRRLKEQSILKPLTDETLIVAEGLFRELQQSAHQEVIAEGISSEFIDPPVRSLELRYRGIEGTILVEEPTESQSLASKLEGYAQAYANRHRQLYGYIREGRSLEVVSARIEVVGRRPDPVELEQSTVTRQLEPAEWTQTWFDAQPCPTGIYLREQLHAGDNISGPAIICEPTSTVIVDPGFVATILSRGEIVMQDQQQGASTKTASQAEVASADPVKVEIFNHLFASIAEQMGIALQQTSLSTNVKERLDFSCGIFSASGDLVVNAPHIPVHLGAMSETVRRILADNLDLKPGDVFVTNDPYRGGSHLPDVTVVTPVHDEATSELLFVTASRAHHAEIGGIVPGSMPPFSKTLAEEGVLIRNLKLHSQHPPRSFEAELRTLLTSGPYPSRAPDDNLADVAAQVAANHTGAAQLRQLVDRQSWPVVKAYMGHIQAAASAKMRLALRSLSENETVSTTKRTGWPGLERLRETPEMPNRGIPSVQPQPPEDTTSPLDPRHSPLVTRHYSHTDHLDDGTPICATITIEGDTATVDFTGTGPVLATNLNANRAIVTAAVLYVFRCLIRDDIPLNSGVLEPVKIILPECLLNPPAHADPAQCAAMVGGNVETSQRVVDVLLGALGAAAASQGTMNNLTFGDGTFGYYETICGGSGATPTANGADAVHTHMTNTRLTDPEVIERRYPVRIHEFSIRRGSGGVGKHRGGDGITRKIQFLKPLRVSLLTERRGPYSPFGLAGGQPGALGQNTLQKQDGSPTVNLGGKVSIDVSAGDLLTIQTPGGGGYGAPRT